MKQKLAMNYGAQTDLGNSQIARMLAGEHLCCSLDSKRTKQGRESRKGTKEDIEANLGHLERN